MTIARLAVFTFVALSGFQQRDANIAAAGDGEISGVVMSAGTTPSPVRRAVVGISGSSLPFARSVVTDDGGRFVFPRLPAGTFRVVARKAAYLEATYGATRPEQEGTPIALAASQRVNIVMTMFKGAAIAGVVRDVAGRPLASMPVSVVDLHRTQPFVSPLGLDITTDDRGAYRVYGLAPGEYLVAAAQPHSGTRDTTMRSVGETDAVLAALAQRQKNVAAQTSLPQAAAPGAVLAPVFHPSTAYAMEAARIRVAAGEERDGVDIVFIPARTGTIEATVSGNVSNVAEVEVGLMAFGPRFDSHYIGLSFPPPDATGKFMIRNLPPGRYRVIAKGRAGPVNSDNTVTERIVAGGSAGGRVGLPTSRTVYLGEALFASADVDMRGQDAAVDLSLRPGGAIAGRVVFSGAKPPEIADTTTIRIGMTQAPASVIDRSFLIAGTSVQSVQTVGARPDLTFQVNGIGPIAYQLYSNLPTQLKSSWTLRSALVDGRDLLDEVLDGANLRLSDVTLTFADAPTTLSGTLQSASGQPTARYFVVVFAADRRYWREGSRRSVAVRPSTDGRFTFPELPAGDYLLAALTDVEPGDWQRAEFLEQLAPAAVRITIGWGERKVQDIRVK